MEMQRFEVWGLIDYNYWDLQEATTHFSGYIAELKKEKYFIAEEDERELFLVDAPTKEEAIAKAALEYFSGSDYNITEIKPKQVKINEDGDDLPIENFIDITVIEKK